VEITYGTAVADAVRSDDTEAQLKELGDLIPPGHRDVGEAMDLYKARSQSDILKKWSSDQYGCREDLTKRSVRVNPASGSAIRYPDQRLSARVSPSIIIMPLTVGLAIDAGGLAVDSFVALDSDLVNVFIDASHACDYMMIDVCCGIHWISACIYSS
jgi:hypothetical protein